ncbi:hypothetical protein Y1Q_0017262 [Alligator mississippiensis]|uniref:Uncharacterized protein n=1 Tax=Alligator mississippiensis TaxID=8496 RepID=A0A151NKX7_ALLMI|nr:hypothetical protein Y1Q_0017262 [Alligator mississippiensis]
MIERGKGWIYLQTTGRRKYKRERGLVQRRDHGFQMCSKPAGVITLQGTDGDKSSEWQWVAVLATDQGHPKYK